MPDISWLIVILGGIGNVILGLTTYLKNPKSSTSRWFAVFSFLFATYLFINQLAISQTDDASTIFWIRSVMTIAPLIVFSFFMLVNVFPKVNMELPKGIFFLALGATVVISILDSTSLIFSDVVPGTYQPTPGPLVFLFPIYNVTFLGWSFIILLRKLRNASGHEKAQLKIFFFGSVIMFSLILFTNVFLVILLNIVTFVVLAPIYTLIFIGSIAYAIIKHRLLDINLLIARTVSYSIIVFLVVAGYVLLIFGLTQLIPELGVTTKQVVVFSAISILLLFTASPLQRTVENITDKIFFKGRYNSEQLLSTLIHIMAEELDIRRLSIRLLSTLNDQVRIVNSAFIVIDRNKRQVEIEQDHNQRHFVLTDGELEKLALWGNLLVFEELPEGPEKAILRRQNISVLMTLKTKEGLVGFLLIGPKASGDIYSSGDIGVMEIFARQAAIAMQNALAYLEIQEFSRTLEKKVEERTRQLKETQVRELAKAQELLKLKDEFVFIATHDLKTPVTAIDGYISLIEEEKPKFSSDIENNFKAVKEASERLKQLVNDLLQVARGESGTVKVDVAPLDMNELVDRVVREVTPSADKKKVKLITSLDQTTKSVMGDDEKLYEVVENLMSNAIKFNKEGGGITITTKKLDKMLQVEVADTGYGIPKAEQAKVFEKFFKYRGDATADVPGTGLGLFVVRMLVEKMGGKISFTSEEGKGTTFSFSLPLVS